ncbi:MAG: response regulator [Nitrospiraceae bacterium]|nr:MAG: response regulator [Nitrospiraceae bacterium]
MTKRILIVDDEALIRSGLSKCLSSNNAEIRTVSTGAGALDEIRSYPYDLCFLDIHLPDINGLDVMKTIKDSSPQTRVVIMTAHHVTDDMKNEIKKSAFSFVGKPFDLSQIKTLAELALGEKDRGEDREAGRRDFKEGRQFMRKPLEETIDYFAGVFEKGELKLLDLKGDVIDISDGGIGIRTDYPLQTGYMIRFSGETVRYEVGVVKWSMPAGDNSYRAGIEFMKR